MRTTTSIILSLALVAGASAPAFAAADGLQGRGNGRGQAAKQQKQQKPSQARKAQKAQKARGAQKKAERRSPVFDRHGHQRIIREYGRRGSLPPGLAKRESLPPGLRKQLRERGTLPPGLQKRLIDVPADLSSRLPAIGRHERRYFAGDDLIVVDTRNNTIVAYVPDVWR